LFTEHGEVSDGRHDFLLEFIMLYIILKEDLVVRISEARIMNTELQLVLRVLEAE